MSGDRDRVILAEVIARCWQDQAFADELIRDPKTVLRDAGMGIPEEKRVEIFDRGARLDTGKPGTGLGLAIVGQIVMLHHGQIALGKATLGGLKVVVTLPVDEENA